MRAVSGMTGDRRPWSAASIVARYEAFIRVSEALRAYHDRDALFRSLARELRPVVQFSFLGLDALRRADPYCRAGTCSRPQGNPCRRQNCHAEEQLDVLGCSASEAARDFRMSKTRPGFRKRAPTCGAKGSSRHVRCR